MLEERNIGLFLVDAIMFTFSLVMLIKIIQETKKDPTLAGLAVYLGGLTFVTFLISGATIIGLIIERCV